MKMKGNFLQYFIYLITYYIKNNMLYEYSNIHDIIINIHINNV